MNELENATRLAPGDLNVRLTAAGDALRRGDTARGPPPPRGIPEAIGRPPRPGDAGHGRLQRGAPRRRGRQLATGTDHDRRDRRRPDLVAGPCLAPDGPDRRGPAPGRPVPPALRRRRRDPLPLPPGRARREDPAGPPRPSGPGEGPERINETWQPMVLRRDGPMLREALGPAEGLGLVSQGQPDRSQDGHRPDRCREAAPGEDARRSGPGDRARLEAGPR